MSNSGHIVFPNLFYAAGMLNWEQDSIDTEEEIIERFRRAFGRDMAEEKRRSLLLVETSDENSATL